jgi:structural maintenance of chromosomes flexible hinge domain-containing protein 1
VPYGVEEWPPGCIDYAVNLVRPHVSQGAAAEAAIGPLRPRLFWTMLRSTLVFTTLAAAEAYRAVVVALHGSCGDIVTLDGRKIRSTGVVCGSTFATVPLHLASLRFWQLPASQVRAPGASPGRAPSHAHGAHWQSASPPRCAAI